MRLLRTIILFHLAAALLAGVSLLRAAEVSETPLTHEQLLTAVTRELSAHFNLDGEWQLELTRTWTPPARVAAAWEITVVEFPSLPSSAMLIRIKIAADGKVVTSATDSTLVLRASLWRDAWVARQPLVIGATFDPSALETRRVDLFRDRDVLPTAVGDRSFIFARGVSPGRLLTWHDIARRPLVKKGEIVEVSAASGMLVVTMKAMAMENGAQGDTVTVRNPESQKSFAAVVVDQNHVQVRF